MDASPPDAPRSLEPLQPIGDGLHLYEPQESKEPNQGPSLIILFTWLGGSTTRRIQKYLQGYRSLWPSSAILLVTTRMLEFAALPVSTLHARLAPARHVIHRRVGSKSEKRTPSAVLLHVFSNGGLYTAVQLALSLRRDPQPLELGPHIRGIILDCCPGQTEFQRTFNAATVALPDSLPAQILGKPFFFFVVGLVTNLAQAGFLGGVNDLRRQLNDPGVFGTAARRLYLYSKEDRIVGWKDVESHIEEANYSKGYAVEGVMFPGGAHCALVRSNETRYWETIKAFWERAGQSGSGGDRLRLRSRL